jgi:uncharacterized membrane protein YfcA
MRHEAYPLLLAAGMAAGFVNTLAGGGSHLTLPLLILIGLDPNTANGTNRVGVLVQNVGAIAAFGRHGRSPGRLLLQLLPVSILGAYLGARVAVDVPPALLKAIVIAVILLTLPVLRRSPAAPVAPEPRAIPSPRLSPSTGRSFLRLRSPGFSGGCGLPHPGGGGALPRARSGERQRAQGGASSLHGGGAAVFPSSRAGQPAGRPPAPGGACRAWIGARAAIRRQRFVRAVIVGAILISIAALLDLPARLLDFHG